MGDKGIFDYEHPFVTTDAVLLSVKTREQDNYRMLPVTDLRVLLYRRKEEPFADMWCLPGGFLNIDELPEDLIKRKLLEKANVDNVWLEQLYTFGELERDPRSRVVSIAYIGMMTQDEADVLNGESEWFIIQREGNEQSFIRDGDSPILITKSEIGFDHYEIIQTALARLKGKIEYTDIAFNLLPAEFTLTQLQNVYEAILGRPEQAANFRRKIAHKVTETDRRTEGKGHRPAKIFIKKGEDQ